MDKRLLTSKEMAPILGISEAEVRRSARLGYIPYYRFGRLMRFDPAEVLEATRQRELKEASCG
ncbi:MAG: helix-turn-helix domain-containing protein [Actinomycetota bacterium]